MTDPQVIEHKHTVKLEISFDLFGMFGSLIGIGVLCWIFLK